MYIGSQRYLSALSVQSKSLVILKAKLLFDQVLVPDGQANHKVLLFDHVNEHTNILKIVKNMLGYQ